MPKIVQFGEVLKIKLAVKQSYQTGQFLIGQKLVENAKTEKFKCDIFVIFKHCA